MDSSKNAERIAHWDNIKFVLITLVVIGHFIQRMTNGSSICKSIFLFIYAFHMPVFLFISGLFYNGKNIKNKVIYLISCGVLLKVFLTLIQIITLNENISFSLLSDSESPWFFFVLAYYQVLGYLLRNTNKKFMLAFCIILACFVGYDKSIGDFLYLSRTIVFFPFFLLGNIFTQEKTNTFISKHYRKLVPFASICILIWLFLCFYKLDFFYTFRKLFTGRNPFYDEVIRFGPLARLFCYVISFMTGASVIILIPHKRIPLISSWGTKTENVYFWHYGLFCLMIKYLNISDLCALNIWGKLSYILIAIALTILLSSIGIFDYPLLILKKCLKAKN